VQESLSRLERKLESGEHDLAQYPADSEAAGSAPKTDKALAQENERLKTQQLAKTRVAGYEGLESPSASPSQFKQQVEPALSGTRVLSESVRGDRRLLMLIDDDELTGDLLVGALNGQAYEITSVRDGVEALHELRRIRPDVIFMDIGLPGIDGVSLTRRLKASPHLAQVPVVMITGDARRETITRSIEAGAADFIVKPFTRESLTAKLQKLLSV
jgi:CheY-like chemotaxis protein